MYKDLEEFINERRRVWSSVDKWTPREIDGFVIENLVQAAFDVPMSMPYVNEYGIPLDIGDGGVDLTIEFNGKPIRLDVKTSMAPEFYYTQRYNEKWILGDYAADHPRCDFFMFMRFDGVDRLHFTGCMPPQFVQCCPHYNKGELTKGLSFTKDIYAKFDMYIVWRDNIEACGTSDYIDELNGYIELKLKTFMAKFRTQNF